MTEGAGLAGPQGRADYRYQSSGAARFMRWLRRILPMPAQELISRGLKAGRALVLSPLALMIWIGRCLPSSWVKEAVFNYGGKAPFLLTQQIRHENYVVLRSDRVISRSVYLHGSFDFEKIEKVLTLIGGSFRLEHLVDIGANIGTICIPAVRRGLARRATAIEPEPRNFRALMANLYLNDVADKIACHPLALGAADGQTLYLELSDSNGGDHRIAMAGSEDRGRAGSKTIAVSSATLDKICAADDPETTLIWIDTQGYEGHVLQGAKAALANRVPLVLEFWPYGMARARSYDLLKQALGGYRIFYDLAETAPEPVVLNNANLDRLARSLGAEGGFTDILVL